MYTIIIPLISHHLQQSYYEIELGLQSDFDSLDLGSISREKNVGEIVKVIELVVVAAVRSPDR